MSTQLKRLFRDESEGLSELRKRFLGQMEHPSFGSPMRKLRFLQLVFKQCHESLKESSAWVLVHGTEMLTPLSERTFVQLECACFGQPDLARTSTCLSSAHTCEIACPPLAQRRLRFPNANRESLLALFEELFDGSYSQCVAYSAPPRHAP